MDCFLNERSYKEVEVKASFDSFEGAKHLKKIVKAAEICITDNCKCKCRIDIEDNLKCKRAVYFEKKEKKLLRKSESLYKNSVSTFYDKEEVDSTLVETKESLRRLKEHAYTTRKFKELSCRHIKEE